MKTQYPKLINSSIDAIPEYDGFILCEMEELFYKYTPRAKLEGAYDYIIVSKIHANTILKWHAFIHIVRKLYQTLVL